MLRNQILDRSLYLFVSLLLISGKCLGEVLNDSNLKKRSLSIQDYDYWKTIESASLSKDGRWIAYTVSSPLGDGQLIVLGVDTGQQWIVSRGNLAPHLPLTSERPGRDRVKLTADSRYLLFSIATEKLHSGPKELKYGDGRCVTGLGILRLLDGHVSTVPCVDSFATVDENGRYLVYTVVDADRGTRTRRVLAPEPISSRTLVIRDLHTDVHDKVPDVREYVTSPESGYVAYIVQSIDNPQGNGVFLRHLRDGHITTVTTGLGDHRLLTFDSAGRQFAFASNWNARKAPEVRYSIYYCSVLTNCSKPIKITAPETASGVAVRHPVKFTRSGEALTFGLEPELASSTFEYNDSSTVELWRWTDPVLLPEARLVAQQRTHSYLATYNLKQRRWMQLARKSMPQVFLTEDARYAVGVDQSAYKIQESWGENMADIYVTDLRTGAQRLIKKAFQSGEWISRRPWNNEIALRISPNGKYVLFFEDRRWFSYSFEQMKLNDLTGGLLPTVKFNQQFSHLLPSRLPTPAGILGWTQMDRSVLLSDAHDIWEIDFSGKSPPRNITAGIARRENLIFRIWPQSHEQMSASLLVIDETRPMLLMAVDLDTFSNSIWRVDLRSGAAPQKVFEANKRIKLIDRSENPERYLITQESFEQFPDLWLSSDLQTFRQVSNVNFQQPDYHWGSEEMVEWTSTFGMRLKGLLFRPADFDPSKRYPLLVNPYGWATEHRFTYRHPRPEITADISSPALFLAKGYLVFMPDIVSLVPFPGEGAVGAVTSGVQSIIERGFVDLSRVGLIGHSWGGYLTNYLVTRTNMFRCAISGAGMSNTLSDYFALRAHGMAGMFIYEHGGFSHGSSIWERPFVYLVNSPIFFADQIRTPLLIMHNENDGTIAMEQSIQLYLALRRNRRESYLINYKREGHHISDYRSRLDWNLRMEGFFDHFLRDKSRPHWLSELN